MGIMLKRIRAKNLKSKSIDYALAPISVFVAENGIGKSAVKEAVQLATNKFCPHLGAKESLTMQLANGDDMTVTGTLADGRESTQKWSNKTPKYFGAPVVANPPIMADIGVFFAMTGPQRAAHVFNLADPANFGLTEKDVLKVLAGVSDSSERAANFKAELIEETKLFIHEAKAKPITAWVQELANDIASQFSDADRDVKWLVLSNAATVKAGGGELFRETVPDDIDQQLADAREKVIEARDERAKGWQAIETIARTLANIENAKRVPKVEIPAGDPDAIEKEIAKLGQDKAAIKLDENAYVQQMKAESDWSDSKADLGTFTLEYEKASDKLAAFKEDCICSECKRVYPEEMVKAAKKELVNQKKQAKARLDAEAANEDKKRKASEEATAANKLNRHREENRNKIADKISTLQNQRTSILQARAKAQAATPNLGDETELRKQLAECHSKSETLRDKIEGAAANVSNLEAMARRKVEIQQDAKRAQEQEEARWNAQAKFEILKAAKAGMLNLVKEFNEKVWTGFVAKARRLTDGTTYGGEKLTLDFKDGELIYWRGAQKITTDAMSGAQRLLAHCGLQLALCESAPLRIIIADELSGPVDNAHAEHFVAKLHALIQDGALDNAIILDWNPRYEAIAKKLKLKADQFVIHAIA